MHRPSICRRVLIMACWRAVERSPPATLRCRVWLALRCSSVNRSALRRSVAAKKMDNDENK